MKKLLFSILFIPIFFAQSFFSCTLSVKQIGEFDKTEFVFIGKIVGYTKPFKINGTSIESAMSATFQSKSSKDREAVGLIIKVEESVFLPKMPKNYFEVFPIDLWADCSVSGFDIDYLKKKFPVNADIRVIAKESKYLPSSLSNGNIRLEVRPDEPSSISLNYNESRNKMSFTDSVFDYKSFKYDSDKDKYDSDKDSDSKYLLPNFEIRKDLLRLEKAENQTQKNQILDRLFYAPTNSDLNFYSLFKTYAANKEEASRYNENHIKMTSPEFYEEQYKPFTDAVKELVKRGYSEEAVEKAIGKALQEVERISATNLVEKSLEILEKNKKP